MKILEGLYFKRDHAQDRDINSALLVDVRAKPPYFRQLVRDIELVFIREASFKSVFPRQRADNYLHLFRGERMIFDLRQMAVDAKEWMLADLKMHIRSFVVHSQSQELRKSFRLHYYPLQMKPPPGLRRSEGNISNWRKRTTEQWRGQY